MSDTALALEGGDPMKTRKPWYEKRVLNYVEAEIYAYPWMEQEIKQLRADIVEAGPDPTAVPLDNRSSNTTESKAMRLITSVRLKKLSDSYEAISGVLANLDQPHHRLVELKYWDRQYSDYGIAHQLHVSVRTFYNWKDAILREVAARMGIM
jgi:RinA family phage transcriptional activator